MRSRTVRSVLLVALLSGCTGIKEMPRGPTGGSGGATAGRGGDAGSGGQAPGGGRGGAPVGSGGAAAGTAGAGGSPGGYRPPTATDNCGPRCFWGLPGTPPANPNGSFGGVAADPGQAPGLVYPLADSLHAINLLQMTFQWRRGASTQALFRVRMTGAATWDFFAGCDHVPGSAAPGNLDQCVFSVPPGSWGALAFENRGRDVSLSIAATDGRGGAVATGSPVTLSFSPEAVEGALYYWSTSLKGTMRALFGAERATPFITPLTAANPLSCGGCHAVSRNGDVIAFAATPDDSANGILTVAPTLTPGQPIVAPPSPVPPASHNASLIALSPTGDRAIVSHNLGRLTVWDTRTGVRVRDVDPAVLGGLGATYPDWSPDGQSIAVTLAPMADFHADWAVTSGQIAILPFNGGAVGAPRIVVPSTGTEINAAPSFSPDGAWILFVSAPPAGAYADISQNPRTRLRLVRTAGGTVHELTRATQQDQRLLGAATAPPMGAYSTWPKFAPYVQDGGNVMFFTFHSRIDYGWVLPNHLDTGRPQLWFAAIDLRRLGATTGVDPSYAPVWLTLQDVTQGNHLGFWTEKIGCGDTGACASGQICYMGRCQIVVH